jgi:glutaredoxin
VITIYSKANCPNCEIAKQHCALRGIKYTEVVLDDEEKMKAFKAIYPTVRAVPYVIAEDGSVIGGFSAFKTWLHSRES